MNVKIDVTYECKKYLEIKKVVKKVKQSYLKIVKGKLKKYQRK